MKFFLAVVLSLSVSLSASAQWYNISFKKHVRYPAIASLQDHSIKKLPTAAVSLAKVKIPKFNFQQTDYNIELAESAIMKVAQHNMRFRIYDIASYNFSDLAKLYIKQSRFSEAKWFLLQSSTISRQQNNNQLTIANLMDLAIVKANMGDALQAQQDLAEALQLSNANGLLANVAGIQKELKFVQQYKPVLTKAEWRYAADAMATTDKKNN
ncbi:hypothetical protein [Mucilaginibacter sp.]